MRRIRKDRARCWKDRSTIRTSSGVIHDIDYDQRREQQLAFWKEQNGRQSGDPAKLARALLTIASEEPPPRRFIAGADAIATAEQRVAELTAQIEAHRALSTALDFD